MRSRGGRVAATALVAAVVPLLALGNGVLAVGHAWLVHVEYRRLPADTFGMPRAERTRLALAGLRSVQPWHREGIRLLERTHLADGSAAFDMRELRHMRDVRARLTGLLAAELAALALLAVLAAARAGVVARGLRAGSLLTLGIAAVVGALVALDAVGFLDAFHRVFFSGDSWQFADRETLRRLYPDAFWRDVALLLAAIAVAQALALLLATHAIVRRQANRPARRT